MKIALIIADDGEFAPIVEKAEHYGYKESSLLGCRCIEFKISENTEFIAVLCGIGKVNAAAATAAVCTGIKPDAVLNFGLSGAISGVHKNDVVIGTKFLEHDFDLTPLGREIGTKPQAVSHFTPDSDLVRSLKAAAGFAKECVFVSGDCFVCDSDKKKFLTDKFNAGCCDMESAAVASVCYSANIPFASFRLLSDDADENAAESYRTENEKEPDCLIDLAISAFA